MSRSRPGLAVWMLFLVVLAGSVRVASAQDTFSGVARVVAIGDIHGDHDKLVKLLRRAGLIDAQLRWAGGRTHLVQTGDILDRGPDSKKSMDLLRALETQALAAGGRVHALIGNHEAMNLKGDLRYVSAGEFAALGDTPTGEHAGHRRAFAPTGTYGRWIASHNAVVKINGTLFLHGGISPAYARRPLAEVNAGIRRELVGRTTVGIHADENGPLWYRGLAQGSSAQVAAELDVLLAAQGATRIVVGHTIQERGITSRSRGRLVLIDVGLSRATSNARAAGLVIDAAPTGERLSIIYGQ